MNVNWDAIVNALAVFGLPIIAGIALIWILAKWLNKRYSAKPIEKTDQEKFLEAALAEDPIRKPKPNYTYADFKRDLYDRGLTFEEIYEKCGGVFPQQPKEPETKEETKPPEGPGAKSDDPERLAQLQEWYKKRTEGIRPMKLVPPPPAPHTVIHKIYTRGRR